MMSQLACHALMSDNRLKKVMPGCLLTDSERSSCPCVWLRKVIMPLCVTGKGHHALVSDNMLTKVIMPFCLTTGWRRSSSPCVTGKGHHALLSDWQTSCPCVWQQTSKGHHDLYLITGWQRSSCPCVWLAKVIMPLCLTGKGHHALVSNASLMTTAFLGIVSWLLFK